MLSQSSPNERKDALHELEVHVSPADESGWEVRRIQGGGWKVIGRFARKRDAEIAAREHLVAHGGGTVVIYRLTGEIEERDEIPLKATA